MKYAQKANEPSYQIENLAPWTIALPNKLCLGQPSKKIYFIQGSENREEDMKESGARV